MGKASGKLPKRYGWNTPVTAPGPLGSEMFKQMRGIMKDPLTFLEQSHQAHGSVIQFPIPFPATYSVSSAAAAKEVLATNHKGMSKRTVQYNNLSLVTGEGLLTAETVAWRPRRRMLQPAFHQEMVSLSQSHVLAGLKRLDEKWQELTADGSAVVDMDEAMMTLALEITCGALFGLDVEGEAEELTSATLTALHGVVARAQNPASLPLAIPTPSNFRMSRAIKRLDRAVAEIISAREANALPPYAPIRDMLDVLLDPDVEVPLTSKQIRDEIVTFLVAGHETVASALTWAWDQLVRNPGELSSLALNPDRASLVFDESLRLFPPAWVISRKTTEDVIVEGIRIPAKSLVIVSPWVVHRNELNWSDASAFTPDRFKDGIPQLGYIPFGSGPRLCIGREMAKLEGSMILGHIAANWNLSPVKNEITPIEASVTLRPVGGLAIRIARKY
jgi:cytochrome P450